MKIDLVRDTIPLGEAWPEPIPLGVVGEEPQDYPLEALPPVLLDAAREVARFNKVPVVSPAVVGLSVAATAIGRKAIIVERPGLEHNLALFMAIIAKSGERKSPAFKHMVVPLEEYEADRKPQWDAQCGEIAASNAIAERIVRGLESGVDADLSDVDRAALITRIAQERQRIQSCPASPRLYTTDTTEERLFQLMHEREGNFAVLTGEGRPVIDSIMGKRSGDGFTGDAIYLAGISGDPITRDRVSGKDGPESLKIPHPMLNVCVMVQPDKYMEAATHPRLRASGALARIWPAQPLSMIGRRFEGENEQGLDLGLLEPYRQVVRQILDTEPRLDDDGRPVPHRIVLGTDAARERRTWHNIIEAMMAEGGDLEDVADIAAKAVTATVKAAGVLHVLQHPEWLRDAASEISLETWKSARLLGEFHLGEAIRIQRSTGESADHAYAQKVVRWLATKEIRQFEHRDLSNRGPRPRPNADEAKAICETLCDHGIIRPIPDRGDKRTPIYEVRPDLVAIVANVARGSA